MNDLEYHIAAWAHAMEQTEYFSLDKSTPDQLPGIWDKLSVTYDDALGSDTTRVERTLEILERLGALTAHTVAIDIGCGTGSFALELAQRCKLVYALDNSTQMLGRLCSKAQGASNIVPILSDWRTIEPAALDSRINLALSCLNPAINDFESLDKMNAVSNDWCCYINALGNSVGTNTTRNELQEIIFGRALKSMSGNSVTFARNIIEAVGYETELWDIPCAWNRSVGKDSAVEEIINDYSRYIQIGNETKRQIEAYVESKLDDKGLYTQAVSTTLGVVTWMRKLATPILRR